RAAEAGQPRDPRAAQPDGLAQPAGAAAAARRADLGPAREPGPLEQHDPQAGDGEARRARELPRAAVARAGGVGAGVGGVGYAVAVAIGDGVEREGERAVLRHAADDGAADLDGVVVA